MTLLINSRFAFNSIYILESLRTQDGPAGMHLEDAIHPVCDVHGVQTFYKSVSTLTQLDDALQGVFRDASVEGGAQPVIHIDAHGSRAGIELNPSRERVSWGWLFQRTRRINEATGNNLLLVLTACNSSAAFSEPLSFKEPAPFWAIVGARDEPDAGFVRDAFPSFYASFFQSSNFVDAERCLAPKYEALNLEQLLLYSLFSFVLNHGTGKGRRDYQEELTSKLVARYREQGVEGAIKDARKMARRAVDPFQLDIDRYKRAFLFSGDPRNATRYQWSVADLVSEAQRGGSGPDVQIP